MEQFTNPENKRKWAEAMTLLDEFRTAQEKAEGSSGTADAFPATKLLLTEAAPRATTMFFEISKMIDEEDRHEATPARKRLLKTMADVRGNFAASTAQLRMFIVTGDPTVKEEFWQVWRTFEKHFAALGTIVADIASASAEQASGIDQINRALNRMDEVMQQNSALVEQNAGTAKALKEQQSAMNEQVRFFKFSDNGRRQARSPVSNGSSGTALSSDREAGGWRKQVVQTHGALALAADEEFWVGI